MIHRIRHPLTWTIATWAAVATDLVADVLHPKGFAAVLGGAIVATMVATATRHANRVEAAMQAHSEDMSRHVLTAERFFKLAIRSDTLAKIDATEARGRDTGPFQVYNGGAG